ncbi:hypothetical protein BDR03DRAFT_1014610 [Suillus americanus]|nr:hypothetical protein BDR03DRAFT_1014610 [Suillus americanus]
MHDTACRAKHPPVTIDALCIVFDNLDLTLPFDAAVCAVALVAFWCCCHLGELIIQSPNLFDPLKHVSCAAAPSAFILQNQEQTCAAVFHIP